MKLQLKPLNEQVIVLTGATSGIGLVTARQAAERGARLVLVARNEEALERLEAELMDKGGDVLGVSADVGNENDIERVADEAISTFGGFDTWINNAGVSIYGNLLDVDVSDSRQLFETNFWGVVNGSTIAARHLRLTGGGAIINVGSVLSERAIPLQGMYCASKHAVKGFTEALRMELEATRAPISVTLVKPSAIDTPYKEHAKNYLSVEPKNPPPVYAPDVAADAILHCCENPTRDVYVGGGGRMLAMFGSFVPRTTDVVMETTMIESQKTTQPRDEDSDRVEGLYESRDTRLRERGDYEGHVMESSVYTKASMHPLITGSAVAIGLGGLIYALSRSNPSRHGIKHDLEH